MTRAAVRTILEELLGRKFNPNQPRDEDGRWTDGMPGSIVSQSLQFARGGSATIDRPPGDRSRLTVGGRSAQLSTEGPSSDLSRLRRLVANARYEEDGGRDADGVYRLTGDNGTLISVRPVPGRRVTDTGQVVDSAELAPNSETYPAEYDVVVGDSSDFDNEPSVRVSLSELEDDIADGLEAVAAARRVDAGFGPVDVYTPGRGRLGLRVLTDDGPVEVEFNRQDWKNVWAGIHRSLDRRESVTVETANGPIEIQTDNPGDAFIGDDTMLFISSPGDDGWSIGAQGDGIKELYNAMRANGRDAGIVRGATSANRVAALVEELVGPCRRKRS